jgi:hypothetical protein
MRRPSMEPRQPPVDRKLWRRMNEFITEAGGWVVSLPDTKSVRFECPLGSELPELLRQAGHRVFDYGTHERLMPSTISERRGLRTIITQVVAPGTVAVWQLDLPSSDPKPIP